MENKEINLKKYIKIAVIIVLVLWGLNWILLFVYDNGGDRGTFGDMFGTVNALFSGLAFGGIIVTILIQMKELKDTREEFKIQNQTMKLQRFENTFFQMVDLHRKIVDSISSKFNAKESVNVQKDVFHNLVLDLRVYYLESSLKKDETFNQKYKQFYLNHNADLGHYFRNLYRIIKLVDESILTDEKATTKEKYEAKYKYTSILRAQLSDDEKILLYYNCHSYYGKKFRPLINKYTLLKGVNPAELPMKEARNSYENEAFVKPKTYIPELS